MPLTLEEAAARHRRQLIARERGAVREMERALREVERRLLGRFADLSERIDAARAAGEIVNEAWLGQQARAAQLLIDLEWDLLEFSGDAAERLTLAQQQQLALAEDHARRLAELAAGDRPRGVSLQWNRLPSQAIENLVGYASDGSPLRDLFDALGPAASQGVRDALVAGLAQGSNPRTIAREIRRGFGLTRTRAEAIARTETIRAYREASRQSFALNRDVVEGWTWHASLDRRTCPACWALHGTEHTHEETLDGHVQCRCVMVPRTKSWGEILRDDSLPDTRPQIEPGADLFGRLDADSQRAILGPGGYSLFAAGDVRLEHFVTQDSDPRWGTMRRPATLDEARAHAAE